MLHKQLLIERKIQTPLSQIDAATRFDAWTRSHKFSELGGGRYTRGKKLASWLSMSIEDLLTILTVKTEPGSVSVEYDVEVRGQYLNDVDYRQIEVEVRELEASLQDQAAPPDRHQFQVWRAKFFYGTFALACGFAAAAAIGAMEMRDLHWWQAGLVVLGALLLVWAPILVWGGGVKIQPGYLNIERR